MAVTTEYVEEMFGNLADGRVDAFFDGVADDVSWTIMGTHPLAGRYSSKAEFREKTSRLDRILVGGIVLKVEHTIVSGDEAAVEMVSLSTARNGKPFNNTYCWVVRFAEDVIVEVRAYLDSALVQMVIDENK